MNSRNFLIVAVCAAVTAAAPSTFAQFNTAPLENLQYLDNELRVSTSRGTITLQDGDIVAYDTKSYTVGKNFGVLAPGKVITVNGQKGIVLPGKHLSFAVIPYTVFSVSGSLVRASDGALVGGTQSTAGVTISGDLGIPLQGRHSLEVGGFYYRSVYTNPSVDLYMGAVRWFPEPQYGIQVAYLNSTKSKAESTMYTLLWRLPAVALSQSGTRRMQVEVGVGLLNNLTKSFDTATARYVDRSTLNFTSHIQLGLELSRKARLVATQWFIRDRSNDISRFGIGVAYRF